MKRVLFVVYGGGHVNIAIPLLQGLQAHAAVDTQVLGLSVAMHALRAQNIPHYSIRHFRDIIMDADARKYGRMLADRWHVEGKGITREESEIYLGSSMRDLVLDVGEEKALALLHQSGRQAFYPVNTAGMIVDHVRPDVIVTTNVPRMERAAVAAGAARAIPTLAIHDYLAFEKRHKLEADKIAVMCDITAQNLISAGHDPEKIVITGHPVFEKIPYEMEAFDKNRLHAAWGLSDSKKYILLATQPGTTTHRMIRSCAAAVLQLDDYELIVKPHPGEDFRQHRAWCEGLPGVHLITDAPIRELVFCAALTITVCSTAGFESILMEKPLIQLNLTGAPNLIPLYQYGVAIEVTEPARLLETMQHVLYDRQFRETFAIKRREHFSTLLESTGTKNIIALIEQMAGA